MVEIVKLLWLIEENIEEKNKLKELKLEKIIEENKKTIKIIERFIMFGKVYSILSIPFLLSFVIFSESMRIKIVVSLLFILNTVTAIKVSVRSEELLELKEYTDEIIEDKKRIERLSRFENKKIKKINENEL